MGQLALVCAEPPVPLSGPVARLALELVFHGLKSVQFGSVSYFALVFAALMCALEFHAQIKNLNSLFESFLYKFLNFFVIESLKLNFKLLFESVAEPGA